jgi:GT2 family glycosyltransferase
MTDPLDPLYRQNPRCQPEQLDPYWLLANAEGWGVACDVPAYQIWSAFDGRPTDHVIPTVSAEIGTTAAFVESTAKVLARAGLLIPSRPLSPLGHSSSTGPVDLGSPPLVSVIILAGPQALAHLETCLSSVLGQTYPELEVIVVDNQRKEDLADFVGQSFPQVKVVSVDTPLGFDAANNLAMKQANGEFFFLLNDDTEMESDCVAECVSVITRSDRTAVVVPKMKLFFMRSFLNSIGNSLYPNGQSCDNFVGYLDVGQFDDTAQVFSACFGAALLRSSVVEEIGYLDEAYSFYFEDTDWSYRARISGHDVVAAPRAIVYHKFNASMDELPSTFKLGLVARNRMRFIWKNLNLGRALRFTRIYVTETLRHIGWATDKGMADIVKTYGQSWWQWLRSLPNLAIARRQTRRLRHPSFRDDATFALVETVPRPMLYGRYPLICAQVIRDHYMQLEIFRPESSLRPESPLRVEEPSQVVLPPPADVATLLRKARQALSEKGVVGLMKETGRYLYWRFTVAQNKQ